VPLVLTQYLNYITRAKNVQQPGHGFGDLYLAASPAIEIAELQAEPQMVARLSACAVGAVQLYPPGPAVMMPTG